MNKYLYICILLLAIAMFAGPSATAIAETATGSSTVTARSFLKAQQVNVGQAANIRKARTLGSDCNLSLAFSTVLPLKYKRSSSVLTVNPKGTVHIKKAGNTTIKIVEETGQDGSASCKLTVQVRRGKPKIAVVGYKTTVSNILKDKLNSLGFNARIVSDLKELDLKEFDGLVVPGSEEDVNPFLYGAETEPKTDPGNLMEDTLQIDAVRMFKVASKPILGVCKGAQLINVALGGTLCQHIGWHKGYRSMKLKSGSWLYRAYRTMEMPTLHSHYQCVDKLGKGLVPDQWDVDTEYIEGFEHISLPIYGVQWHPESMGKTGNEVFYAFKRECRAY